MSTAATTNHHFPNPIAMAAAAVVIVGGATVIGIAGFQSDSTSTTPAPTHAQVVQDPPSRVGLGDFAKSDGAELSTPNRGDFAAPPQGGTVGDFTTPNRGDFAAPPQGGTVGDFTTPNRGDYAAPPQGGRLQPQP